MGPSSASVVGHVVYLSVGDFGIAAGVSVTVVISGVTVSALGVVE